MAVPQSEPKVQLQADLTNADLCCGEHVAWKKPAGRTAILQCDIAKGKTYKTELQNFKVAGDDIAIEGWAAIGADNQLREFSFPGFLAQRGDAARGAGHAPQDTYLGGESQGTDL